MFCVLDRVKNKFFKNFFCFNLKDVSFGQIFFLLFFFIFSLDVFAQFVGEETAKNTQINPIRDEILRYRSYCGITPELCSPTRDECRESMQKCQEKSKQCQESTLWKSDSCVALGEAYLQYGDRKNANLVFLLTCKQGNPFGCLRHGSLIEFIQESAEGAIPSYKKACELGLKEACVKLKASANSEMIFWASLFLIGMAVFIVVRNMVTEEDQYKASEKLESINYNEDIGRHGIVLKYSRPFFNRYVSPIVKTLKYKTKIREKYKRKLATAGLTNYLSPEDFFAFKLFLIIGFPVLFLFLREFLEYHDWPLSVVPIVSVLGFFYPDIWINGKIKKRQDDILLAMPFAVDMLALSVEAGLDFMAAMGKVIQKAKPSPLTEEFEIVGKEIKIGSSRAEALRNLAWRVDMVQITSFCATLIAADSVGASIGPILKALSNEMRQKRSAQVEKKAATASTKILIPTIFFILPAVFLVILGPVLLGAMMGGSP